MSYTYVDRVSVTVDFRLIDRIKPRLTRVAIALGFPSHSIEVLEKKSDPECYLLSEWLSGRSTKASDRRPLTWGTLITALRHAGLMEEVRILEEHFIVTPVETVSQTSKQLNCKQLKLNTLIIGASLSEPHIDGDVCPTSRGMFVYMYVSGRVVRLSASYVPENTPIQ